MTVVPSAAAIDRQRMFERLSLRPNRKLETLPTGAGRTAASSTGGPVERRGHRTRARGPAVPAALQASRVPGPPRPARGADREPFWLPQDVSRVRDARRRTGWADWHSPPRAPRPCAPGPRAVQGRTVAVDQRDLSSATCRRKLRSSSRRSWSSKTRRTVACASSLSLSSRTSSRKSSSCSGAPCSRKWIRPHAWA